MLTRKDLMILLAILVGTTGFLTTTAPAFAVHRTQVLHRFSGNDGQFPYYAGLIFDKAGNLYGTTYYGGSVNMGCGYGCGTVFQLTPDAKGKWTQTTLHQFQNDGQDGNYPAAGLIIDAAGNLYGTTTEGGAHREGAVFELARRANGSYTETVLYSFCSTGQYCTDGGYPFAGLVFDKAGNLYGTTSSRGTSTCGGDGCGVVFQLKRAAKGQWTENVLHSFNYADGFNPKAGLIFDAAKNLYGTAGGGFCFAGGTVFELSHGKKNTWTFSVLYSFSSGGQDGACPSASLVLGASGHLYGTTYLGGAYGAGTVFELTHAKSGQWNEKVLHSFDINDGAQPYAGLIRDSRGNLYGTLAYGGRNGFGSVFQLLPSEHDRWTEKMLHNFTGIDGTYPYAGLAVDATGHLYGATYYGGNLSECLFDGCGVIFEITP